MESSPQGPLPPVSVVIATRNRGSKVTHSLESIVSPDTSERGALLELLILDQSDDGATEQALAPYLVHPRLRYIRTHSRGLSAARNEGIEAARGEWIAFTDDDCTASPGWLEGLQRAFNVDARLGVILGNVVEGPHDPGSSFVPGYRRTGSFLARSIVDKQEVEGIGANMAVRKSLWRLLGGFDLLLGAGSRFHAAEELDFVMRALLSGHRVYETDGAEVVHYGFRANEQKSALAYDYCFGIGAVYGKLFKCGRLGVLLPLVQVAFRWALGSPRVSYGSPPRRAPRLRGFADGAVAGFRTPVDCAAMRFVLDIG